MKTSDHIYLSLFKKSFCFPIIEIHSIKEVKDDTVDFNDFFFPGLLVSVLPQLHRELDYHKVKTMQQLSV